jgi:tetratricopeptide (TPR) repeat protein
METSEALEFVNRGAELLFLRECLERSGGRPALILIRAPAGFGKSRLTEQFSAANPDVGRDYCIVDPSIRGRTGATALHAGFFMQRCAEALDAKAQASQKWPTLAGFLKGKPWRSAGTKKAIDVISDLPTFGHAYRVLFDYAARALSFGRFAPKQLLVSDQADAVALCSAYAEFVLTSQRIVLIVREAHHVDLESLRTLLLLNERGLSPDLILEYTSDDGQCEPEHQKLFLRRAEVRGGVHLLDLLQLDKSHLEYLIKRSISKNFDLSSDYYLSWSGNLRSIVELRFQVGIGRTLTGGAQIGHALGNLSDTLANHIEQLSSFERLILAIVLSNVEAVDRTTLSSVLVAIDPRTSQTAAVKALEKLETAHAFLSRADGMVRIQSETIAIALEGVFGMKAAVALAERALRDHYAKLLLRGQFDGTGMANAVRHYFRLCARTRDAAGLLGAVERLSREIKSAQDQSIYVDVVASAIEADPDLYAGDQDELIDWAASLAYDICDWPRAETLVTFRQRQDAFSTIMRACALQEIGGHDEALKLATEVRNSPSAQPNESLAGWLLEALIIGCRGEHAKARGMLTALVADPRFQESPLLGYAYRFFEVVDGFVECLPRLQASIAWFDKHGFKKSKAYSQLPAAMFLARSGDVAAGHAMIAEAQVALADEVRDQHMILNNGAAVELLSDNPDFSRCGERLLFALRLARDDFTELTILNNLALSYQGSSEFSAAIECVEKCMSILRKHDFADTDIYWPVCFNASVIYGQAGELEKRDGALHFPADHGRPRSDSRSYWDYRFHGATEVDERYRFLASRPWHPLYLSHWLIDLEGLNLLKTARPQ